MKLTLRPLKNSEIPFLEEMLYTAIYVPQGQPKYPKTVIELPEIRKYIKNWGHSPNDIAIVAIQDQHLVGACWGRIFNLDNKGYGFVSDEIPEISIAIKEKYRNKGIGTKLLDAIEKKYADMGINKLSLSVDKTNPAKGLYLNIGYKLYEDIGTSVTLLKEI